MMLGRFLSKLNDDGFRASKKTLEDKMAKLEKKHLASADGSSANKKKLKPRLRNMDNKKVMKKSNKHLVKSDKKNMRASEKVKIAHDREGSRTTSSHKENKKQNYKSIRNGQSFDGRRSGQTLEGRSAPIQIKYPEEILREMAKEQEEEEELEMRTIISDMQTLDMHQRISNHIKYNG